MKKNKRITEAEPAWKELYRELKNQDRLIESKYLQTIASMRPWDNCFDFELMELWEEMVSFYYQTGRYRNALDAAERLAEYSLNFRWTEDDYSYFACAFRAFYSIGEYEKAIEYAEKESLRQREWLNEKISHSREIDLDSESGSVTELFEEIVATAEEDWDILVREARIALDREERSRKAFMAATVVVGEMAEKLVKENGGKRIDLYQERKLKRLEQGIGAAIDGTIQKIDFEDLLGD